MSKPEDEKSANAARVRALERELKTARLDALIEKVKTCPYSELLELHDLHATSRLDADDERILDANFVRGFVLGDLLYERNHADDEQAQHVRDSLAAVRGQLRANREAGLPSARRDTADTLREKLATLDFKIRKDSE